jgi:hypothetical protein
MGKRKAASVLAVVLSFSGVAACAAQSPTSAGPSTAAASTSSTPDAGALSALAEMHRWLNKPGTANMLINTVETDNATNPVNTLLELTGVTNVATGALQMTGKQWTVGASTITNQVEAVESGGTFYSTVAEQTDASSTADTKPPEWTSTAVSTVRPKGSIHSLWWLALQSLTKVHLDGSSVVDTKNATEYTGTVNLASVPGISAAMLKTPLFKKAASTQVSVDLYTNLGTGALVRLTYRLGLRVSIDDTPVGQSMAGFQVDLTGFGAPTPLSTPVAVPAEKYIIPGGNDDLCRLLIF